MAPVAVSRRRRRTTAICTSILHGIDFRAGEHGFATHDIDFFLGPNYLVTVHDGTSRSIVELRDHCPRNAKILGEGPVALFHRIVDAMVDHYRPEVEKLEDRLDELEKEVFENPRPELVREILDEKRDVVVAAAGHHAAARRHRAPGAARLRRHQHGDVVPVPRRLRPARPDRRRCADLSGPHHGHPRRAPVEREQPAERGHEGADRRVGRSSCR